MSKILITGAAGLIGRALRDELQRHGFEILGLDIQANGHEFGDVRDADAVRRAIQGCVGIVHLAAVSRVVWGEQDPVRCWETNVGGLKNVLAAALAENARPWLVFASSREVYGQPDRLPADEDTPLRPVNIYARSKVEGERLVAAAGRQGLRAATVRFSNVFGCIHDHVDRVVPAFARAAAFGQRLRVDGAANTFDFTHASDVVCGLTALIKRLDHGWECPPPIHFVSGRATTLSRLAGLAIEIAGSDSTIEHAPPRSFDVAHFCGDPARAHAELGWAPLVSLEEGLASLINAFRAAQCADMSSLEFA